MLFLYSSIAGNKMLTFMKLLFGLVAFTLFSLQVFFLKYLALRKALYVHSILFIFEIVITYFHVRKLNQKTSLTRTQSSKKKTKKTQKSSIPLKNPYWMTVFNTMNMLLFIACLDLSFRDYFFPNHELKIAKLGMVNATHVKMMARLPPPSLTSNKLLHMQLFSGFDGLLISNASKNKVEHDNQTRFQLSYLYKKIDEKDWSIGSTLTPKLEDDFVVQAEISDLIPDTRYHVKWNIIDAKTKEWVGELETLSFKTFPLRPSQLKFVYSSCVRPGFPYGLKELKGFREMAKQEANFLMFLGDLIYSDYPIYFGSGLETYRAHYRRLFNHPDSKKLFKMTPSFFVYDDHEIINDWANLDNHPFSTALQAFNEYAGHGNPKSMDLSKNGAIYFKFDYGSIASFFFLDTRRYRSIENHTMLGEKQLNELKKWLEESNSKFKLIVSSVPFTLNFPFNGEDTWRRFKEERNDILNFIQQKEIKNVIVLSGDRHEVAITRMPGNVIELSTSPLLQFYGPIETYEEIDQDEKIFTWRFGNVKWASIEIDKDVLVYKLFVNDISS